IYSSDYNSLDPWDDDDAAFRSYIDDEYMGHKWQCVEFARRFLRPFPVRESTAALAAMACG
ncbi:hypothetical protein KU616_24260, partial [Salmonella enterica subsp. enterica serovar Mbandaka]|nr:hypothetical protein [Salmonella enterica subsp. enterica serovar Mbandaka]